MTSHHGRCSAVWSSRSWRGVARPWRMPTWDCPVPTRTMPRPTLAQLVYHQFRYQNKVFWRTPIAAFFTIVFPLMLLVLFTAIFGNDMIEGLGLTTAQC